jgi:transposase
MGDWLILSSKERKRKVILEKVLGGELRLIDAAPRLEVGYRQAKRLLASYRRRGDAGLVHASRGKPSHQAYSQAFKQEVLEAYESQYLGFGPTFASEKLMERDKLKVQAETLRLWLLEAKLWKRARKRKAYRQRRRRRERFGELVQIDGSDHAWFGKEHSRSCLLNMVDDATTTTLSQMDTGETCRVLLLTFKEWVETYGVPMAVYVDLKNVYVSPKRRVDNDLEDTMNVFERVCSLLNVEIIKAYSPQAKGRVERNHAVYQDRFVKELSLCGVNTIAGANKLLSDSFVNEVNKKFAKHALSEENAHTSASVYGDLNQIFCWEYTRQIRNDFTIRFQNTFYQLEQSKNPILRAKQKVFIRLHLDDTLSIWRGDKRLGFEKLKESEQVKQAPKGFDSAVRSASGKKGKQNSPWNNTPQSWFSSRKHAT